MVLLRALILLLSWAAGLGDRDFDDGVLGLAWVGAPSGSSGGICEKSKLYSDVPTTGKLHSKETPIKSSSPN
uniref:ADAM metallopeptidase domain 10 n=1 Tax=Ailuropoda melanoleuca TaxID=9646 RepID=A0A7N5P9Q4_AILME